MTQPTKRLAFELCVVMHQPNPDTILHELTSRQITEWAAFLELKSSNIRPPDTTEDIERKLHAALGR